MKHILLHITVIMLVLLPLPALAQDEPHDTVYFYKTWEQLLYQEPVSMLLDPYVIVHSPFQLSFEIDDENMNYIIGYEFMAASMGDSICFINSNYLKDCFHGDIDQLTGYIPLSFNDKMAYFRFGGYPYGDVNREYGLRSRWNDERTINQISWHYYFIDFAQSKVLKVNHSVLSALLQDYHDLQMRYEGMKNYKKREIMEDYFLQYIDRATSDIMHPYILDLVE